MTSKNARVHARVFLVHVFLSCSRKAYGRLRSTRYFPGVFQVFSYTRARSLQLKPPNEQSESKTLTAIEAITVADSTTCYYDGVHYNGSKPAQSKALNICYET